MATDYGSDMSCVDDLDAMMTDLDGVADGPTVVAQAIYRRITTPRGMVIDAPDYGIDVAALLHKGMTRAELLGVAGVVRKEIMKDDRVASVDVVATHRTADPAAVDLVVRGTTLDGEAFSLTGAVTDGELLVQEMG